MTEYSQKSVPDVSFYCLRLSLSWELIGSQQMPKPLSPSWWGVKLFPGQQNWELTPWLINALLRSRHVHFANFAIFQFREIAKLSCSISRNFAKLAKLAKSSEMKQTWSKLHINFIATDISNSFSRLKENFRHLKCNIEWNYKDQKLIIFYL